ncbi:hypothetical protein WA026_008054 [Henosepilachna vigintioctopunctata]|uniref:Uncharacterized protein n=1 Tax=Henosepilachna vigintioctopunctata TaxID=420089 RepID=A0AAW1TR04_9CUCU
MDKFFSLLSADDSTVAVSSSELACAEARYGEALSRASGWFAENGLCLNEVGLQRRAVRICAGLKYRKSCVDAFANLGFLTFYGLFIFESLKYAHKHVTESKLRGDFHPYETRGRFDIRLPVLCRSQRGSGFLSFKLYNKLPLVLACIKTPQSPHELFSKDKTSTIGTI